MIRTCIPALAACLLASTTAIAQPAPAPTPAGEATDAKALMQSGLKLFAMKDYLGALAVFRDAYSRVRSAKILLNIGTTLTRLDRKADAANAYQQYLDSQDADPKRVPEVRKALDELDHAVGTLELQITPAAAEVQLPEGEWISAAKLARYRAVGEVTLHVRADHFQPETRTVQAVAGARLAVEIALAPTPAPAVTGTTAVVGDGIATGVTEPAARSRFGAVVLAHVDLVHPGGAALVGIAADLTRRIQLQATALIGKTAGGYASGSFAFLDGRIRPIVVAGIPIFISDGPRISIRGAGGVELELNRHLALVAEVGVEYVFNPEPNVAQTLFVPAIGATGRL
jgi:hypothetical protein